MKYIYWTLLGMMVFNVLFLVSAFFPPMLRSLRLYRKLRGGRWEKRGHWHGYPHSEALTNRRRNTLGKPDDVEDWYD